MTKVFGSVTAVEDVTIDIPRGSIFGLLGPDGAGKSTFLKMLATVLAPTQGSVELFGWPANTQPGRIRSRLGYMPQRFCLYPDLTVNENVEFFATVRGVPTDVAAVRRDALLAGMGMSGVGDRPAGKLSGGMKQKLMLATTVLTEPELVLLDEPTTGVDPVSRQEFWATLETLRIEGTTIVVATPYMDEAARCTDLAFLADGRLSYTGTPSLFAEQVEGRLFEVSSDDPRSLAITVAALPHIVLAYPFGDVARIVAPPTFDADRVRAECGLAADHIWEVPMDLETAFVVTSQRGRS